MSLSLVKNNYKIFKGLNSFVRISIKERWKADKLSRLSSHINDWNLFLVRDDAKILF